MYKYVTNYTDFYEAYSELNKYSVYGFDTETRTKNPYKGLLTEKGEDKGALDPYVGKVRLIQISAKRADGSIYIALFDLMYLEADLEASSLLHEWLDDPSKLAILHNAKFDFKMMLGSGYKIDWALFDTQLAVEVLHAGKGTSEIAGFKLVDVLNYYLDIPNLDKTEQKSDWGVPTLSESQLKYAALDVYHLPDLRDALVKELKAATTLIGGEEKNLIKAAQVEFGAIKATSSMEYNGIKIDLTKWNRLIPFFERKKNLAYEEVINRFPYSTYYYDIAGNKRYTLNINSSSQVLPILQELGIKDPRVEDEEFKGKLIQSTGKDVLKLLDLPEDQEEVQDLIDTFLEFKKAEKMLSAFIYKLPDLLHPLTGRLHTTFRQHGADTSRYSSKTPNLQQIPSDTVDFSDYTLRIVNSLDDCTEPSTIYVKEDNTFISVLVLDSRGRSIIEATDIEVEDIENKEEIIGRVRPSVRECFVASREDYSIVVADFSQIEVRIVADEANEPIMIEAYQKGQDIYKTTYAGLNNVDYDSVTKEQRKSAKPQVLGLNYMMGALGFKRDVKKKYNMSLTLKEAVTVRKKYLTLYEGLSKWHKTYKDRADKGCRKSYNRIGRYRVWLDKVSPNALCNYPIQSTSADITKIALYLLYKEIDKLPLITVNQKVEANDKKGIHEHVLTYLAHPIRILLVVHDEIVLECPTSIAQDVANLLSSCMKKAGEMLLDKVPVEAEAKWGESWAEKA